MSNIWFSSTFPVRTFSSRLFGYVLRLYVSCALGMWKHAPEGSRGLEWMPFSEGSWVGGIIPPGSACAGLSCGRPLPLSTTDPIRVDCTTNSNQRIPLTSTFEFSTWIQRTWHLNLLRVRFQDSSRETPLKQPQAARLFVCLGVESLDRSIRDIARVGRQRPLFLPRRLRNSRRSPTSPAFRLRWNDVR